MPKMKTHSGAKKRFKATRTGKLKSRAACRGHRLVSKSKDSKREGRSTYILKGMDAKVVLTCYLPYQRRKHRLAVKKINKLNALNRLKMKEAA